MTPHPPQAVPLPPLGKAYLTCFFAISIASTRMLEILSIHRYNLFGTTPLWRGFRYTKCRHNDFCVGFFGVHDGKTVTFFGVRLLLFLP